EGREHHPIAAGEQQQDRQPHPGKEFLEGAPHQPQAFRRLERAERRSQADIDREHAADPDDGTEWVKGEGEGGHEEGSRFEAAFSAYVRSSTTITFLISASVDHPLHELYCIVALFGWSRPHRSL